MSNIAHWLERVGMVMESIRYRIVLGSYFDILSARKKVDEMNEKGMLRPGDKIICVGFGGGLTWGATLMEWS